MRKWRTITSAITNSTWFVLATERPDDIDRVLAEISSETGLVVHDMRKLEEFFVGLRFEA